MKAEYEQFIGIYDDSVPVELCDEFVTNYALAKKNNTIIDLRQPNDTGMLEERSIDMHQRRDEAIFVLPTLSTMLPIPPCQTYYGYLKPCFDHYMHRYSISFGGPIFNDLFKIHKVAQGEGYHVWHYENGQYLYQDRILTYMTYLEVPKKGGETEFLHQSLRIEPKVGRTLLWPVGFTHMHRGNPPLEGEKMYITGWFQAGRDGFVWNEV